MKKAKGFAPRNSCGHLNLAIEIKPGTDDFDPIYLCTYTLPVEGDGETVRPDAQEPILLTAYPHPDSVSVVFNSMLHHFRRKGWEQVDTGNWTTMAVYPEGCTSAIWQSALPLPVRVRKLSPAQQARAAKKLTCQAPEHLPILQVQLPDPQGYWPGEQDYHPKAFVHEKYIERALGELT